MQKNEIDVVMILKGFTIKGRKSLYIKKLYYNAVITIIEIWIGNFRRTERRYLLQSGIEVSGTSSHSR